MHRQDGRGEQQQPRNDLKDGEGIPEPMIQVEQDQEQDGLKREESEEAVRVGIA